MYDWKIEQSDECGFGLYQGLAKSIEISFPRKKNQDKNIVTAQILQALNLFDTWIKSLSHEWKNFFLYVSVLFRAECRVS